MGGCRCSYKNCTNTTKTRDNLHFFHYPVKQKDRCRQWIENAQKPQFYDLDEDQLRNKVICETHFETCYFPNIQKKRLLQGAIPTLEGDCEKVLPAAKKEQDVNILQTDAEGTVFVLETHMETDYRSEKVESYIYTNNGLVLPINKCNDSSNDCMQTLFTEDSMEVLRPKATTVESTNAFNNLIDDKQYMIVAEGVFNEDQVNSNQSVIDLKSKRRETDKVQIKPHNVSQVIATPNDAVEKSLGTKYINKINKNTKDIAMLKRIIKARTPCRKPTNSMILGNLQSKLSPSLFNLVNFNLNQNMELGTDDFDLYSTIYSKSPELYQILIDKFKWKLPSPEKFDNLKNNGH